MPRDAIPCGAAADAALVAADPGLPGLRLLLDATAFAAAAGVAGARPLYLRYKPGESCLAGFRLSCGREISAKAVTADRWATVDANSKWAAPRLPDGRLPRRLDGARILIRDRREDPGLRALSRLDDPERADKHLRRLLDKSGDLTLTPLRWKPERRFVARIDRAGSAIAVLKVSNETDYPRALAGAAAAQTAGGPRLMGASAPLRAFAVRWTEGATLCPEASGRVDLDGIAAAGRALAELHRTPLRLVRDDHGARTATALAATAETLARLLPDLGGVARALASRIAAALLAAPGATRLIHGDFTADQALWDGRRAGVIDWDEACDGDPAADFGAFRGRLEAQALDGVVSEADAARAQEALVAGYAGRAEPPFPHAAQAAAALLRLTVEGFRERRRDWPARAAALLERAEAALDGPGPFAATLARALSRQGAAQALADATGAKAPQGRPRLIRLKHGRRALVAYRLQGADGEVAALGKLRAKGLDARAARLSASLRAVGFVEAAPDGIATPAPLGMTPALSMWLQAHVPGRPAADLLTPGADPWPAARVGAALAKLRRLGPSTARRWTLRDELVVLERALAEGAAAAPSLPTAALAEAAVALAGAMPEPAPSPAHRDFHPEQALIDGERVWLIDLDLYAMADPALDAGNFVAHLIETGVRLHGCAAALDAHAGAFLAAWAADGPLDAPGRVPAWTTLALARCAAIAAARPSRRHAAALLAETALERFAALGSAPGRRLSA